jgi:nucleoid-associated protein YgaU
LGWFVLVYGANVYSVHKTFLHTMGLLNFFKGVGEKIFGKEHDVPAAEPAKAAAVEPLKAQALLDHVKQLGLAYKTLTVKTAGDTVTLMGEVSAQEDAEKIALAVGNVEGVHVVDNQLTVDDPTPPATYHEVKSGDTLSAIAKEVYGDAMKYGIIFEANKPMLKSPDLIYPGQMLRIPQL